VKYKIKGSVFFSSQQLVVAEIKFDGVLNLITLKIYKGLEAVDRIYT
jgi:hypothetical protein